MKIMILGLGEIGKAIYEVVSSKFPSDVYGRDVDFQPSFRVEVVHICYPYSEDFVRITNNYLSLYNPDFTIVHTTTPPGTCEQLQGLVAHCPIRGRHQDLVKGILEYEMVLGYNNQDAYEYTHNYMTKLRVKTKSVSSSKTSELLKLLSLTHFAFNIEFARLAKECCDKYDVDYSYVKDYTNSYNRTIERLEGVQFYKSNLNPPEGKIGGHCVLNAVSLLNTEVPNPLLTEILKINKELGKLSLDKSC